MKKVFILLGIVLIAVLVWTAAGPNKVADPTPMAVPLAIGASPAIARRTTPSTSSAGDSISGGRFDTPVPTESREPVVPADVIAPIATATATTPSSAAPRSGRAGEAVPLMRDPEAPRPMIVPVAGVGRAAMRDMFNDARGGHRHEAIDILAPRGTPVIAADDGVVKKLFTSVPGGLTVYEFDPDERFCYYYAHLDRYAAGLHEGQQLHRGEVLGYVGTTGNAPKNTPHLHFALIRLDSDRRWWKGTYVNPYPLLAGRQTP